MKITKLHRCMGIWTLAALLLMSGCDNKKNNKPNRGPNCSMKAGDIVITELMANPAGKDNGNEWFEIYNASDTNQIINHIVLRQEVPQKDGSIKTKDYTVKLPSYELPPDSYFVFGDAASEWVDFYYESGLNDFSNTASTLSILCNDEVIDSITYGTEGTLPKPKDGVAIALDGSQKPNSTANDDPANWCYAVSGYDQSGNLGTPGEPNAKCGLNYCTLDGQQIVATAPIAGDLVITEIVANPKGTDGKREYIEILNTSATPVDLAGMTLEYLVDGTSETKVIKINPIDDNNCMRINSGYAILGRSTSADENCGIAPVVALLSTSLVNSSAVYSLVANGTIIDSAPFKAVEGSYTLDSAHLNSIDNDDPVNWCIRKGSADCQDKGTPGFENESCDTATDNDEKDDPIIDENCTGSGPAVGDLVITEILANPKGADGKKEYIEIFNASSTPIELAGMTIEYLVDGTSETKTIKINPTADNSCIQINPGYSILGRSLSSEENCGIAPVVALLSTTLVNSSAVYSLVYKGKTIDSAPYVAVEGAFTLDSSHISAVDNDDPANWCGRTATEECVDNGTPGLENATCEAETEHEDESCEGNSPEAGDLIITELFTKPEANQQFVEIYATKDVVAKSLTLVSDTGKSTTNDNINFAECNTFKAGKYYIFAASDDQSVNGNLVVDYVYSGARIHIPGTGRSVHLKHGNTLLSTAPNTKGDENKSFQLSSDKLDSEAANDVANWCTDVPTPGAANTKCQATVDPGDNTDNPGDNTDNPGDNTDVDTPAAGDIIITEFVVNPHNGSGDTTLSSSQEYIEIYNMTVKTFTLDVSNIQFKYVNPADESKNKVYTIKTADGKLATTGTISIAPGYSVFGRSTDSTKNCGISPIGIINANVNNASGLFTLVINNVNIDEAPYVDGKGSYSLAPIALDATANDSTDNWCFFASEGLCKDHGTPSTENNSCSNN